MGETGVNKAEKFKKQSHGCCEEAAVLEDEKTQEVGSGWGGGLDKAPWGGRNGAEP